MRTLLLVLITTIIPLAAFAQEGRGIGFPTVAAALEALKGRNDVRISNQGGWTIVEDRSANTFWSFTPPNHPAHPAAIKRIIVSDDRGIAIQMSALCQASKAACDKLIAEFKDLNERLKESLRNPVRGAQSAPPSEIEVQRLGDDSFRLVLKSFRSRTVDAGQEELVPKAREVCGEKNAGYGRYEFETVEPVGPTTAERHTLILKQDITCGAVPSPRPPTVSAANRDRQWRPTAAQAELVERLTYAYFSAKDGRRYQEAYAQLSATQKQTTPFERWSSLADDFNSKAGEVRSRNIKKITWYKDPPGAGPGVYAAADFSSRFANADIHCGYVVWHEQADGSFLLVREEQNIIDKATEQKLKPGELEKVRAQLGC
jgi:hypothetical protein